MKNFLLSAILVLMASVPSLVTPASGATSRTTVRNVTVPTANTYQHEIIADATAGSLSFSSASTQIGLGAGYGYFLPYGFEAMLSTGLQYSNQANPFGFQGQSSTAFNLLVGPAYNIGIDGNLRNAFFISFQAGFEMGGGATSFAFAGNVGKRFALFQNIAYSPRVGIFQGAGAFTFNIVPIAASFLF